MGKKRRFYLDQYPSRSISYPKHFRILKNERHKGTIHRTVKIAVQLLVNPSDQT